MSTTRPAVTAAELAQRFAITDLNDAAIDALCTLYTDDVVFTDPIQTTVGLSAFADALRSMAKRTRNLRIEMHTVAQDGDELFLTWTMSFDPRPIGPRIHIEGISHCQLRHGLIARHRDYWDLLGSFAATVPLGRTVHAALMKLLA